MQARGVGNDAHGVPTTDRRPTGNPRDNRRLTRSQSRPAVDIGIGAELLDEIDGDLEPLVVGDLQILRTDADSDRLTRDLVTLFYQEFFVAQDYGVASAVGVIVVIASLITATFALRTASTLLKEEIS